MSDRLVARGQLLARMLFLVALLSSVGSPRLAAQGSECSFEGMLACIAWAQDVCRSTPYCASYYTLDNGLCLCSVVCDCQSN